MILSNSLLSTLKQQTVRDLYWICFSPEILNHEYRPKFKRPDDQWFLQLDHSTEQLDALLAKRNLYLLGSYFEALWEYLLDQGPFTDLCEKNLQILSGQGRDRQTLGEIDFIYYCYQRKAYIHLEVAIKFYLAFNDQGVNVKHVANDHWIGPQSNDRLDIKWDKLLYKQSPLSSSACAQKLLHKKNIVIQQAEITMPGYLFSPLDNDCKNIEASPQHLTGKYCSISNLPYLDDNYSSYLILAKPFWLSNPLSKAYHEHINHQTLTDRLHSHFAISDKAVMLLAFSSLVDIFPMRVIVHQHDWPRKTKATSHLSCFIDRSSNT